MKLSAVYAGSFDPVTNGHLDIIRRARRLFDSLIVLVMANGTKKPLFTTKERVSLLKEAVADFPRVQVDTADGLLVDYLKKKKISFLVRGLRSSEDLEQELANAHYNKVFLPGVETVFLPTDNALRFVSSSAVREMTRCKADPADFVPPCVARALKKKHK